MEHVVVKSVVIEHVVVQSAVVKYVVVKSVIMEQVVVKCVVIEHVVVKSAAMEHVVVKGADMEHVVMCKKVRSYIAQYPILTIAQSALHFTSLTDVFNQTPSQILWEASSHMLKLMREGCSCTHPLLFIARYSCLQLNELEQ